MLAEKATCVPALTPFVAKCYGEMSAPVFLQMESGERREIDCSSGVQQGDAMGPALFCMPLLPVLKRTRAEFEPRGESFYGSPPNFSLTKSPVSKPAPGRIS